MPQRLYCPGTLGVLYTYIATHLSHDRHHKAARMHSKHLPHGTRSRLRAPMPSCRYAPTACVLRCFKRRLSCWSSSVLRVLTTPTRSSNTSLRSGFLTCKLREHPLGFRSDPTSEKNCRASGAPSRYACHWGGAHSAVRAPAHCPPPLPLPLVDISEY